MTGKLWTRPAGVRVHGTRLRREGSEGSQGSEGSEGKVDGASPRRFLRFLSLTAFQAEGCGGGFAADYKKGARLAPRVV